MSYIQQQLSQYPIFVVIWAAIVGVVDRRANKTKTVRVFLQVEQFTSIVPHYGTHFR